MKSSKARRWLRKSQLLLKAMRKKVKRKISLNMKPLETRSKDLFYFNKNYIFYLQMMELEDVVKKVEAKMKKEELEVLALEYEENMVI